MQQATVNALAKHFRQESRIGRIPKEGSPQGWGQGWSKSNDWQPLGKAYPEYIKVLRVAGIYHGGLAKPWDIIQV